MKQKASLADLRQAGIGLDQHFWLEVPGREPLECLEVLRHLPGKRLVFRARWNGAEALVKLFFQHKYYERERRGLRATKEVGVPSPKEIWSYTAGDEGCLLATEFLTDVASLDACYQGLQPQQLKPLLRDALDNIGRLHRAGWMQADIHLDNFLLSGSRLYVIDGGGIEKLSDATANIALFFAQMIPDYDALITEVLDAYGADAPPLDDVLQATLAQREWRIKHYTKKSLRNCTQFVVSKTASAFTATQRELASPRLSKMMAEPEAMFSNARFLKQGHTATVVRVQGDHGDWVMKRYNIKNFWHGVSRAFRPSRASGCWQSAFRLELLGIATPRPLAMREDRIGPLRQKAYLLTDFTGGTDLQAWVLKLGASQPPSWLDQQVYRMFDILWHARVSHGDMKATNLIVEDEQLMVIDLDAMRWHRSARCFKRAFAKDLQRFMDNWKGHTWQHIQQLLQPLAARSGIILRNKRI